MAFALSGDRCGLEFDHDVRVIQPRHAKQGANRTAALGRDLAENFAADGHHVIEVCEPEQDGDARQFRVTGNRARSTLPLEAFDSVTGALVFPCAARTFDLAFFREARMVYLDEPSAPEEARRELLERAEIILGGTTPGAIPTDQLEDAARRLRQSKTADA